MKNILLFIKVQNALNFFNKWISRKEIDLVLGWFLSIEFRVGTPGPH